MQTSVSLRDEDSVIIELLAFIVEHDFHMRAGRKSYFLCPLREGVGTNLGVETIILHFEVRRSS